MANVAIIPARSGSKRVPLKNVHPIDGVPLMGHVVRGALSSGLFDDVVVSTDDQSFASVADSYGASVPFVRPGALSDDHTTTVDVIHHAVQSLGLGARDQVCCIYPTAIMTTRESLRYAIETLHQTGAMFCFPVARFRSPPSRGLRLSKETSLLEPVNVANTETRTQDNEPVWYDAGQFDWGGAESWSTRVSIHQNGCGIEVPWWQAIDVDEPEDLEVLEFIYHFRNRRPHE